MEAITEKDILKLVKGAIKFPYPQVCKHLVALDLLSLLESKGYSISNELVKHIVSGSLGDDSAIEILEALI